MAAGQAEVKQHGDRKRGRAVFAPWEPPLVVDRRELAADVRRTCSTCCTTAYASPRVDQDLPPLAAVQLAWTNRSSHRTLER
jgi:hypothetical protein